MIVGAGGHGKVVLDALIAAGMNASSIALSDDNPGLAGALVLSFRVVAPALEPAFKHTDFHVAIGANSIRSRVFARLVKAGGRPRIVRHPGAVVSGYAILGEGVFLAAGSVVAPDASIGSGCILNHGAVVDHECSVGAFSHIAPNATLGGRVSLSERVLVGAGANILPGISIGADAVIGAGAVVTRDIGRGEIVRGVPAVAGRR